MGVSGFIHIHNEWDLAADADARCGYALRVYLYQASVLTLALMIRRNTWIIIPSIHTEHDCQCQCK